MIAAIAISLWMITMYQWIRIQDLKGNLKELEEDKEELEEDKETTREEYYKLHKEHYELTQKIEKDTQDYKWWLSEEICKDSGPLPYKKE